jgi:NTP pyrophosphatase (non-canonical NTP hydrolase)
MNLKEYSEFVESKILTEGTDRLAENTLGLVGEAGEVAEKIKKRFRDGKLDREAVQKELGTFCSTGQHCTTSWAYALTTRLM